AAERLRVLNVRHDAPDDAVDPRLRAVEAERPEETLAHRTLAPTEFLRTAKRVSKTPSRREWGTCVTKYGPLKVGPTPLSSTTCPARSPGVPGNVPVPVTSASARAFSSATARAFASALEATGSRTTTSSGWRGARAGPLVPSPIALMSPE